MPPDDRIIAGLTVRIDRTLCVGFGDCVEAAPLAFELDGEDVAVFRAGADGLDRDALRRACLSCPVDAISAWDADGRRLFP